MNRPSRLAFCFALIFTLSQVLFSQAGTLDPTFGVGGINVTFPPLADDPSWTSALDMVFQNDGKIVVLARARDTATSFRNVLIRFTPDGQIDATFATGGYLYVPSTAPQGSYVRRLIKQTISGQELLVLAGGDTCGGQPCLRVERYTTGGNIDMSFGTGGVSIVHTGCSIYTAAAVQADQKILLGCPQFPLVRLNANGVPDASFGRNGVATFNDTKMLVTSVTALPDGKILTAGSYLSVNSPDLYLARFTSNGKSDGSFGSQGKRVIDFSGGADSAQALAVDSKGNIIAAGRATFGNQTTPAENGWDAVIVRLTAKGSLDKTFGSNGKATPLNIGGGEDQFRSVGIQSNGKLVVAGIGTLLGNSSDMLVARYNANGTLDSTFDGDGWSVMDIYGNRDSGSAGLIQVEPGCSCNKLVVTGTTLGGEDPTEQYISMLRYGL